MLHCCIYRNSSCSIVFWLFFPYFCEVSQNISVFLYISSWAKIVLECNFNPFVPNAPFLYPLKTSENLQGFEKGCIGNEWVKIVFNVDCVNVMEINVIFFDLTTVGIPIRTTLDNSTTVQYAGLIVQLTAKARSTVRDIDPQVVKLEAV